METTEHSLYVLDFGTYRLCSFITFLALKILVCLHIMSVDHSSFILLKSIPLYFHTRVCYVFYVLHRHRFIYRQFFTDFNQNL